MSANDIGDPIPLGITVRNASQQIADGGTVVCTVTLPDGTTATPSVSHDGVGLYSAIGPSTQYGLYSVAWSVTGTNASSYPDSYVVTPNVATLVSVADALEFLNLASAPTDYSERLRSFLQGVTTVIEGIVGPVLPQSFDEYYDGGAQLILLNYAPVVTVTAVVEAGGGGFIRTLTNQPPDQAGNFDAYGYTIDLETGTLIRRISGVAANFLPGRRNVHVTYTAGQTARNLANIREATLELVRINWQPQQGGNRPGYGADDVDTLQVSDAMRMGFFVPNRVMEMLAPSRHTWGIA